MYCIYIYIYAHIWGLSLIVVAKWPYVGWVPQMTWFKLYIHRVGFYIWGHPIPAVWQESSCKLRFRFLLWLAAQHVLHLPNLQINIASLPTKAFKKDHGCLGSMPLWFENRHPPGNSRPGPVAPDTLEPIVGLDPQLRSRHCVANH